MVECTDSGDYAVDVAAGGGCGSVVSRLIAGCWTYLDYSCLLAVWAALTSSLEGWTDYCCD